MSAQNGLLEFVSVLQADDVGVVFETRAGCAFAVHIATGRAGSVVAGVVDVDGGCKAASRTWFLPIWYFAPSENQMRLPSGRLFMR